MKTIFLIIIVLARIIFFSMADVVPRLHDEYDPDKWPKAELKLSPAATLKNIFESGLRPYRHPGLENSLLEVKHLNLIIFLGSGKRLPLIQAEVINITPFRDGEIATIEGFTHSLTIEEARAEMLKWLPYGENQRTQKDLDDYLTAVEADFLDFDDPYRGVAHGCSVLWKEPGWQTIGGGPQVVAWFRKTASEAFPLRLYLKATWSSNRPVKDRGGYRPHPIEPPPGFEDEDMTAPKKFGPDSAVDIARAQGIDIGESSEAKIAYEASSKNNTELFSRPPRSDLEVPVTTPPTPQKKGSSSMWYILGCILFILFAYILRRKAKMQKK